MSEQIAEEMAETFDVTMAKFRHENKPRLLKEYRDYVESMLDSAEIEYIEDWKQWTETEWCHENIPF